MSLPLFEVLDRHGVVYDKDEAGKRYNLLMKGLRRDPAFESELSEFKKQKGGATDENSIPIPVKMTKDDFLGSELRWFVEVVGSPYAQVAIKLLFMVLFFVSYLEKIPVFGSVLSAVLDIALAGGRIIIKAVQKAIPTLFGIIPLPMMSLVGLGIAAVVGMLLWPVIAIVSFSRQDFTSAIESFLRIIPPPIGDAIADTFLDANRTVSRLNEKRKKVMADLIAGLSGIMGLAKTTGSKISEGAEKLITKTKEIASKPTMPSIPKVSLPDIPKVSLPTMPNIPSPIPKIKKSFGPVKLGGFSRKQYRKSKWKTQRNKK